MPFVTSSVLARSEPFVTSSDALARSDVLAPSSDALCY